MERRVSSGNLYAEGSPKGSPCLLTAMLWPNADFQVPSHPFVHVHCVGGGFFATLQACRARADLRVFAPAALSAWSALLPATTFFRSVQRPPFPRGRPSTKQHPVTPSPSLPAYFPAALTGDCPSHQEPTSQSEIQVPCPAWERAASPHCQLAPCQALPVEGTGGTRRPQGLARRCL